MFEKPRRSDRLQVAIPLRVRGMSTQTKFFDEETATTWLSKYGLMTRLRNLVDLETEIHVTNLTNSVGGTYRVVWINQRANEGMHDVGLELSEAEGDMWGIHFPPFEQQGEESIARVWLECERCHEKSYSDVPEVEYEYLSEGFRIARHCDRCKGTTSWEFAVEVDILPESEHAPKGKRSGEKENRNKGRIPMKMKIKVTRRVYGTPTEDICETENISRNGVYFLSSQIYDVGERLEVVMPYKEGDVAIPVQGRVVRLDHPKKSTLRAVAIRLDK
jgi:PilZ domain